MRSKHGVFPKVDVIIGECLLKATLDFCWSCLSYNFVAYIFSKAYDLRRRYFYIKRLLAIGRLVYVLFLKLFVPRKLLCVKAVNKYTHEVALLTKALETSAKEDNAVLTFWYCFSSSNLTKCFI